MPPDPDTVGHMTEQDAESTESAYELPPELEIEFRGRKLWVRMPTPEQILVWKRTLVQLQSAEVDGWNAEQVMAALERTRKIIDSVLVHRVDVDWLDDEMLARRVDLKGTAEIINRTVEVYAEAAEAERAEHGTRAERRLATKKPGKKAARKAPTKKART
jgi:hypothetical protein